MQFFCYTGGKTETGTLLFAMFSECFASINFVTGFRPDIVNLCKPNILGYILWYTCDFKLRTYVHYIVYISFNSVNIDQFKNVLMCLNSYSGCMIG